MKATRQRSQFFSPEQLTELKAAKQRERPEKPTGDLIQIYNPKRKGDAMIRFFQHDSGMIHEAMIDVWPSETLSDWLSRVGFQVEPIQPDSVSIGYLEKGQPLVEGTGRFVVVLTDEPGEHLVILADTEQAAKSVWMRAAAGNFDKLISSEKEPTQ